MDSHLYVDMYSADLLIPTPERWTTRLSDHDVPALAPTCSSNWGHTDSWDYHVSPDSLPDPRLYAPVAPATDSTACRAYSSRSASSLQRDSCFQPNAHHSLDASSRRPYYDHHAYDVQTSRQVFDVNAQSFDAPSQLMFDPPTQSFGTGTLAFDSHLLLDNHRIDERPRNNFHPQEHLHHPSASCPCVSCFFAFSQRPIAHAIPSLVQQTFTQQQLHQSRHQPLPPMIAPSPSQTPMSRRRSYDAMIDPSRLYAHCSTPALSSSSTTSDSSASPSPTRSTFSPDVPFAYSQPPPESTDKPTVSSTDSSPQSSPANTPLPTPPPTAQQITTSSESDNGLARSTRPRPSTTRKQPRPTKPRPSSSSSKVASTPASKTRHVTPSTNHTGRPTLACFFCRQRKIACPPPAPDAEDLSCEQCVSRNQSCVYPTHTRRGLPKDKPAKKFTDEDIRNMGRIAREKDEARRKRREEDEEAASFAASDGGSNGQMLVLEQKSAQGGPRKSKRRKTTRRVIRDDDDFEGDD